MMYYRISKNEKNLFFGKKIAQVWAVTLSKIFIHEPTNEPLVLIITLSRNKDSGESVQVMGECLKT